MTFRFAFKIHRVERIFLISRFVSLFFFLFRSTWWRRTTPTQNFINKKKKKTTTRSVVTSRKVNFLVEEEEENGSSSSFFFFLPPPPPINKKKINWRYIHTQVLIRLPVLDGQVFFLFFLVFSFPPFSSCGGTCSFFLFRVCPQSSHFHGREA